MAVPKKRTSSTKRDMRRVHDKLPALPLVKTATGWRLAHHADPDTGQYRGREAVKPKTKSKSS
jgi:large subunit ribosomal protein L32